MRSWAAAALLLFCGGFFAYAVADLPPANPPGTRGLVPLEATEIGLARVEGGFWTVFTGLKDRASGIYARRFDEEKSVWADPLRLSEDGAVQDSRPTLFADARGAIHCAWLSRLGKGKYAILYARLDKGADEWSKPLRFEGGKKRASPRLAGDGQGRVYLYSDISTETDRWGRIAFWSSQDGGLTWEESNPNFPSSLKKGKSSDPVLATDREGAVWLLWLDQTPGGRSVVLNVSADGGRTWRETPAAINADKRYSLSTPQLLLRDRAAYVFWTVTLLEETGKRTEFWTDRSVDAGRTWSGNRRFHSEQVSDVTLRAYALGQDVGCVWSAQAKDAGSLSETVVWRDGKLAKDEVANLLTEPAGSYVRDIFVLAGDGLAVFFSNLDAFDAGRVGVYHKAASGAAWRAMPVSDTKPNMRAAAPVAVLDGKTKVYTVGFHEIRRRPLIGAPEIWDSNLIISQFKLAGHSGDEG